MLAGSHRNAWPDETGTGGRTNRNTHKLRSCDLLRMKVRDISSGGIIQNRVLYSQSKTGREVQFEITSRTAQSLTQWFIHSQLAISDYLFPSPRKSGRPMSYSCYSTIIRRWASQLGYDSHLYGTHSMRRTKATLIYPRTKNIRAVQLLLGHVKLDSTIRYLGVEMEDALNISEDIDAYFGDCDRLFRDNPITSVSHL